MRKVLGAALAAGLAIAAATAAAAVPTTLSFSARLADDESGKPVSGPHRLSFALYSQEAGGNAVWTEARDVEIDEDGVVEVESKPSTHERGTAELQSRRPRRYGARQRISRRPSACVRLRHTKECGTHGLGEIFQSYALLERPQLERSLNFLATVGSNAPFIGLLGTVLGIMKAFKDLSANASSGNEAVMAGIAEALVATAIGLLVAIPAVIAYNAFQKQVKMAMQSIDSVRELCIAYAESMESKKGQA